MDSFYSTFDAIDEAFTLCAQNAPLVQVASKGDVVLEQWILACTLCFHVYELPKEFLEWLDDDILPSHNEFYDLFRKWARGSYIYPCSQVRD